MIGYFLPRHNAPSIPILSMVSKKKKRLGGSMMEGERETFFFLSESVPVMSLWKTQIWLFLYSIYLYMYTIYKQALRLSGIYGTGIWATSARTGLLSKHAVGMRLAPSFLFLLFLFIFLFLVCWLFPSVSIVIILSLWEQRGWEKKSLYIKALISCTPIYILCFICLHVL